MLVFYEIILIIIALNVSKYYAGGNDQLPAASTPKGKEARAVLLTIALIGLALVVVQHTNGSIQLSGTWITVIIAVLGLAVIRLIQFKKKK